MDSLVKVDVYRTQIFQACESIRAFISKEKTFFIKVAQKILCALCQGIFILLKKLEYINFHLC